MVYLGRNLMKLYPDEILCEIPKSAKIIKQFDINGITIQFLQTPVDQKRKTGIFFCHAHSDIMEECFTAKCTIMDEVNADEPNYLNMGAEVFNFFVNFIIINRDNEGITVH